VTRRLIARDRFSCAWTIGFPVMSTNGVRRPRARRPARTDAPGMPGMACAETMTSNGRAPSMTSAAIASSSSLPSAASTTS
jgi:hypothetical protein